MSKEPTSTPEEEVTQDDKLASVFLQGEITKDDFRVITQIMQRMTTFKWMMMGFIIFGLSGVGVYQLAMGEGSNRFIGVFIMAFAVIIPAWFFFQSKYGTTAGYERLGEDVRLINAVLRHDGIVLNTSKGANKIEWSSCNYVVERDGHWVIFLRRASRFIHFHPRYAPSGEAWAQATKIVKQHVKIKD